MALAQQLTDIKSLQFPVVKLRIRSLLKNCNIQVSREKIQIGDNYIIRQGNSILDCFKINNQNQLETTSVYMSLPEFIVDNYAHIRKELIIDNLFRLYSLNYAVEGVMFTTKINKQSDQYCLFYRVPYYLEVVIPNKKNYDFGLVAHVSDIYFHLGWSDKEIVKKIRI